MALRPIIEAPDPRLRRPSLPVAEVDAAIHRLVADMFETMYAAPGIGLAAIQIDVPLRIVVMDLADGPPDAAGEPTSNRRVFINPELFAPSDQLHIYNEGCLSVPELYAEVERPATIGVRWTDLDGLSRNARFDGLLATCIQHEMDHLEGVLFIDRLSRLKRDMILKKLDKARQSKPPRAA
jgi:peptide deformylase